MPCELRDLPSSLYRKSASRFILDDRYRLIYVTLFCIFYDFLHFAIGQFGLTIFWLHFDGKNKVRFYTLSDLVYFAIPVF